MCCLLSKSSQRTPAPAGDIALRLGGEGSHLDDDVNGLVSLDEGAGAGQHRLLY